MRNRSEPGQVVRAGFEPGRIAVTLRVIVAAVHQHEARDSGGLQQGIRQTKDAERRDKMSAGSGSIPGLGKARQKLPKRRRCEKQHRWLVSESNLRVKRSDPWYRANASPAAMAVPVQTVETRTKRSQTCLHPVRKPVAATTSPNELRGLTR